MKSLEEQMAEALNGKFFWERTTKYEPPSPDSAPIRRAQREFAPVEEWLDDEVEEEKAEDWKPWERKPPPPFDFKNRVAALKEVIAAHFRVKVEEIESRSKKQHVVIPKKCFYWSLCRYFSRVSLVQIGKHIGRDHSTIVHGRDGFEFEKNLHADLIAKMDEFMGYKPG
jgi:hypothetical protein